LAVTTNWRLISIFAALLLLLSTNTTLAQAPNSLEPQLKQIELEHKANPDRALSLAQALNSKYPNNQKVEVWLARLYAQFSEFEKGFNYAKQASEQSLTIEETSYVEMAIGYFYNYKQQKNNAIRHFVLAVEAAKKSGDVNLLVEMLSIKAYVLLKHNQVEQAMNDMALAYDKIDLVTKPEVMASLYNTMCSIYIKTGHPDGAIEAMLKSVEYVQQTNNPQQLSVVYYNLARLFAQTNQYEKALEAYQNSEVFSLEGKDEVGVGYAKMGIGHTYLKLNKAAEAILPLSTAESLFLPEQHTRNLVKIYADLAEAYLLLEQFEDAQSSLEKLDAYSSFDNMDNRQTFLNAKETLARLYFAMQDYDAAFQQQSLYSKALKEFHKSELEQVDKQAFERLSNTIMAKENQVLKLANQLKETELDREKRQSRLLLTIAIFSVVITVFVTLLLRKNNKLSTQLDKLATTDELTQLYNRRKIMSLLSERFSLFKRKNKSLYLALFDLDYFKKINDVYGHVLGDKVLKAIAEAASQVLGEEQDIGRYGGEEFLVILNVESYKDAHQKLEAFRIHVANLVVDGLEMPVTVSIGLSEAIEQDQFQTDIIHRADKALYAAKKAGRNQLLGQ